MATGKIERSEYIFLPVSGEASNVAVNTGGAITFQPTIPSGYTAIGLFVWETNAQNLFPVWAEFYNSTDLNARYWNARTSAANITISGIVICKKI